MGRSQQRPVRLGPGLEHKQKWGKTGEKKGKQYRSAKNSMPLLTLFSWGFRGCCKDKLVTFTFVR